MKPNPNPILASVYTAGLRKQINCAKIAKKHGVAESDVRKIAADVACNRDIWH